MFEFKKLNPKHILREASVPIADGERREKLSCGGRAKMLFTP